MIKIRRYVPANAEIDLVFECDTIEQARELYNKGEFNVEVIDTYDLDFDDDLLENF